MDKEHFDYTIGNAEYAVKYLEELSECVKANSKILSNKIFNHALSVKRVIQQFKDLYRLYHEMIKRNNDLNRTVRDYENNKLQPYINEYCEKLKESMIDVIKAYPDIEYY